MNDQSDIVVREGFRIAAGAIGILLGVVALMFLHLAPFYAPTWVQWIIGMAAVVLITRDIRDRWRGRGKASGGAATRSAERKP